MAWKNDVKASPSGTSCANISLNDPFREGLISSSRNNKSVCNSDAAFKAAHPEYLLSICLVSKGRSIIRQFHGIGPRGLPPWQIKTLGILYSTSLSIYLIVFSTYEIPSGLELVIIEINTYKAKIVNTAVKLSPCNRDVELVSVLRTAKNI